MLQRMVVFVSVYLMIFVENVSLSIMFGWFKCGGMSLILACAVP